MFITARGLLIAGVSLTVLALPAWAQRQGQPPAPPNPTGPYTVTVMPPVHGKVALNPALPADGKYAKGTVVTVTATPDCPDASARCITRA
jgi:hypothetical protein